MWMKNKAIKQMINNVYSVVYPCWFPAAGQYDMMQSPLRWDLINKKLVSMAIMGLVFFIITLLCEYRFFIKAR